MSEFKARIVAELDTAKLNQQIQELQNKNINLNVKTDNATKEAQKNINNINKSIKQTTKSAETFGQKLKNAFKISTVYSIAYKAINLISQASQNAVNSVKELNQSLTNLRIVTGANQTEAEQYMTTYNSMARELGATTTEVADAATDWLRQGKSITETNNLIQDSIKLSKVGMINSADATTYLTSALNGYRLEASQATSVVDKLSKLDSSAAVTAGGLAEAMSKTAVSADSAGVTMDRLLGYLSTVGEVTQENMSTIGNAFKTFFARFTAIKTGKLELIDEDGTTEVLSDVEQSLKNVGIDMRSTITEFDNAGDVLDNLYAKWDSLNGVQQNAIANAFGGVRQKERFLALMENYDKAKNYMELSANSAGAGEQKFGAYLDGIEAKTKSLQAAFESLSNNTISSDVVNNITEATTALVTFIDKSNLLDGAITGLLAGGAVKLFTMLKSGISSATINLNEFNAALQIAKTGNIGTTEVEQLAQVTKNLSSSQLKAVLSSKALSAEQRITILTSQGLSEAEATAKISALGLATSEGVAAGATTTLGGTLKGLWATLKANPLLLIIGGITAAVSAFNSYQDSIKEAQKATIDTAKESTDHIKELESAMKSYLELDTSATETDKANALKSVTEQINNKTEALKNATAAEKGYKDAVMKSIEADYNSAAGKAKDAAVVAKEKIAGQWDTDYTKNIEISQNKSDKDVYNAVKSILGDLISYDKKEYMSGGDRLYYHLGRNKNTSLVDTNDIESLLAYYDKLQQAQDAIQQKALELGDSGNALLESPLYKALSEILSNETNKTNIDDYITNRSEEIYNSAIASQGIPETVEQFNTLKDTMLQQAGDSSLLADSITNRLNSAFGSLADEAVKAEHSVSTLDFTITDEELEGQIEGLQDSLSKIADNYKKISGVIDDYNKNGSLSIDNLETLISVGDEYISTLFDENGRLNLNKESYAKLAKAKLEDIRYSMLENAISSLNQLSKDDETSANNELAESTGNLTEETLKLVAAKKLAEGVDSSQIQKIINTYSQWSAIIDNTEAGLENNIDATLGLESASDKLKDSLESEKKALENSKSAFEDKKKALEDYKDGLEDAQDDIQSLIDLTIDYIKQMKENEKDAINEQIDALDKQKDALDDQKDTYSDLISKKKEEIELLYEEKKAQDELSEKQKSAAKDALSLAIAQLDDSSAGKKSQKQAADNYAESSKDLKDYLDEQEKDKRISTLEEEETAYSEMIEKRKVAIDEQVEHLESKIDEIDAYLDNSRKLYEDACNMIDNDNGTLYSNLWNYTYTYTTKTRAEFDYLWSSAQAAIQRYKGDNDTLISTMEILQGKIYDCETQIGYLDDAISSTSDAISATSDSIDSVSGSLDGLGNSISDYINKLNQLNSDTIPKYLGHGYDAASGNYYYKVKFRGRDYYGYVGDSSDTTAVRERAYNAIMKEVYKYNSFNDINPLLFKNAIVNHHAKGTRHSAGGVSVTQEEGLEAIFGKLSQGQYTMMPQGSQVFNAGMTDNLWKFSSDPQKFLSDVISKRSSFLSSSYGDISNSLESVTNKVTKFGGDVSFNPTSTYNIYGNVDNTTLNNAKKQEQKLYEKYKKQFMLEILREKNNL